jgi:hypothetical protein
MAERELAALTMRTEELGTHLGNAFPYAIAENLLGIHIAAEARSSDRQNGRSER